MEALNRHTVQVCKRRIMTALRILDRSQDELEKVGNVEHARCAFNELRHEKQIVRHAMSGLYRLRVSNTERKVRRGNEHGSGR